MILPPSLYHTKDPLTNDQQALVKQELMKFSDSINHIDSKIDHLQDRLGTLSLEQKRLRASNEAYRGPTPPACRLPPEILQEIFFHCLPTSHNAIMSAAEPPLVLGRICSRWRQIAHSTPKLWSSIHIVAFVSFTPAPLRQLMTALQHAIFTWLSRSGTLPLSMSMIIQSSGLSYLVPPTSTNNGLSYLDLIAPYAHRWRSIHFSSWFCLDWAEFFDRFPASQVPLLESLHISGHYIDPEVSEYTTGVSALSRADSILRAPRLRILSVPLNAFNMLKVDVRWGNITSLDFAISHHLSYFKDIVEVLRLCTNLEKCIIAAQAILWVDDGLPEPSTRPVVLPKLRSLGVYTGQIPRQFMHQIFVFLITPALRHLLLPLPTPSPLTENHDLERSRLRASLILFLQHLVDPLEELDLTPSVGTLGENMMDILSLVPGLKRLSIDGCYAPNVWGTTSSAPPKDDFMLAKLTPVNNQQTRPNSPSSFGDEDFQVPTCLCPKLEVLHCKDVMYSDDQLLRLLYSRTVEHHKHNVSHLRKVSVRQHRRETDDIEDVNLALCKGIEELEKETGLRVVLRHDPPDPVRTHSPAISEYSPYEGLPIDSGPLPVTSPTYFGF